jgi:GNAT superfamily N-acetyltransferase
LPSTSTGKVDWLALAEGNLSPALEAEIRDLLVTAFPEFADFFSRSSYRGSVPEYRLLGRTATGELVAHLEFGCRQALVGAEPVNIVGIGAVAVHPRAQGRGIGKRMFGTLSQYAIRARLGDFGFLECRESVAGFYERVGFNRVRQACTSLDHESLEWETYDGPVMVMPLTKPMAAWPAAGDVNLRGKSW